MSEETETTLCPTCKQDVPTANLAMHSIHCQRFLTTCPHCKESVNKKLLKEHIEEDHAKIRCNDCKESMEKIDLESHKETSCKRRTVECPYCEIGLAASDMDEHKDSCGSRTEECETCQKRVLVKDLEVHVLSGCRSPEVETKNSKARSGKTTDNIYNKRTNPSQGFPKNSQFLKTKHNVNFTENRFGAKFGHKVKDTNEFSSGEDEIVESLDQMKPTSSYETSGSFSSYGYKGSSEGTSQGFYNEARQSKFVVKPIKNDMGRRGHFRSRENFVPKEVLPDYGIPDSDSNDEEEEKLPPSDLSETFLPCEFCNVHFPADMIVFHQATCDKGHFTSPPLPSQFPDPFLPRPRVLPFDIEEPFPSQRASGSSFEHKNEDVGDEPGPCEFCDKLFPMVDLAMHQCTCSQNPVNLRQRSPLPSPPTAQLPQSTPPPPTVSSPPTTLSTSKDTDQNVHNKTKKSAQLAPSFRNKPATSSKDTTTSVVANINPPVVDEGKRENLKSKRSIERVTNDHHPVKYSPGAEKNIHEINRLGSGAPTRESRSLATEARKPYDSHYKGRNSYQTGGNPTFGNPRDWSGSRGSRNTSSNPNRTADSRNARNSNRGSNRRGKNSSGGIQGRPRQQRGSDVVTFFDHPANQMWDSLEQQGHDQLSLHGLGLHDLNNTTSTAKDPPYQMSPGIGRGNQRPRGSGGRSPQRGKGSKKPPYRK